MRPKFSASASGDVKSSGDANASANASLQEQPAPAPQRTPPAIQFREGRLDYKGVINFEYDKANLQKDVETQNTLAEFKTFLTANTNVKVEVQGHTDSRGSDEYNRELSDRRAASVRQWLLDNGISADRVTSVGKGEDQPQQAEPEACNDKEPADTAPCEAVWASNRRVVFQVTGGAETLPAEPKPAPPPPPVAAAPAPAPVDECPWLFGGHLNGLGPNSWVGVAGATQPGVCWLELSLGVGLGWDDDVDAEVMGATADGSYFSLTVPLRGRFWFMKTHSLIADAGVGFTHYWLSADLDDGTNSGEYERPSTPFIGHLGLGYGLRPNGAQAGPRLALIIGGLLQTKLSDSEVNATAAFTNAAALQAELDQETNDLDNLEPYGEISIGWLF